MARSLTRRDFAVALAVLASVGAGASAAVAKSTPGESDKGLFYRRFRGEDEVRDHDRSGSGGSDSDHNSSGGSGGHETSSGSHDSGGPGTKPATGGGSGGKPPTSSDDEDTRFGSKH